MPYTTEVYKIIQNEKELDKFIDQLPDLGKNFKYYVSLFARKKYGGTEGLKSDKCQLKRFVASKELLKRKLKQLEVPVGYYDIDGLTINEASLVVYISVNPRDMHKAGLKTVKALVGTLTDEKKIKNPQAEALSQIQVVGQKIYFNVDIDFKELEKSDEAGNEFYLLLLEALNPGSYEIIETRGGYHVLVILDNIDSDHKKSWYNTFRTWKSEYFDVDLKNGDGMTPIPGCIQANFTPKLLS